MGHARGFLQDIKKHFWVIKDSESYKLHFRASFSETAWLANECYHFLNDLSIIEYVTMP
jgi:hypothetical protein